jgi:predicted nuclease of predicted toxin-antitoxin system
VRILLDECVPVRLARHLNGHTVASVRRQGWNGLPDQEVIQRAAHEFDVFLTVDQSLEFQQALPHSLILLTVISSSSEYVALRELAPRILERIETAQPGQAIRIDAR